MILIANRYSQAYQGRICMLRCGAQRSCSGGETKKMLIIPYLAETLPIYLLLRLASFLSTSSDFHWLDFLLAKYCY